MGGHGALCPATDTASQARRAAFARDTARAVLEAARERPGGEDDDLTRYARTWARLKPRREGQTLEVLREGDKKNGREVHCAEEGFLCGGAGRDWRALRRKHMRRGTVVEAAQA